MSTPVGKLSWRGLATAWNQFFHAPVDLRIVSMCRIAFALVLLVNLFGYGLYAHMWFGEDGVLPYAVSQTVIDPDTINIFSILPKTMGTFYVCFGIFIAQTLMLLVGWQSRTQAICCFLWLTSFQNRNSMIVDGEDTVFRLICFFLIFMPIGAYYSLDSKHKSSREGPVFGLRLLQLEMTLIFLSAFWEKCNGQDWLGGHAMYYTSHLDDLYGRLYTPDFLHDRMWMIQAQSWGTLVIEAAVPIMIWFKETRLLAVVLALFIHFALDFTMNLFMFQSLMVIGWFSFVKYEDLQRLLGRS